MDFLNDWSDISAALLATAGAGVFSWSTLWPRLRDWIRSGKAGEAVEDFADVAEILRLNPHARNLLDAKAAWLRMARFLVRLGCSGESPEAKAMGQVAAKIQGIEYQWPAKVDQE